MKPAPVLRLVAALGIALIAAGAAADPARAAEIIQGARDAAKEWNDYTCAVKIETISGTNSTVQLGKMNWLKPDHVRTETTTDGPGGATKTLFITDGRDAYTETRGPGDPVPAVFHYKNEPRKTTEGEGEKASGSREARTPLDMYDRFSPMFDWDVDSAATGGLIQDMEMDVLVGKYRKGAVEELLKPAPGKENDLQARRRLKVARSLIEGSMGTMKVWVGRQDKFMHRIELIPPANQPTKAGEAAQIPTMRIVTTYLDVKFNQNQTPADFVYTPPAGVEITEMPAL